MINLKNTKLAFKRYLNDNTGSMAMTWVIAGVAVIFATGSAYDFSQVSRAKAMAQLAADNMALAASVAVDFDNSDKYVEGVTYSYSQMGGPSEDFTNSITGQVFYDIVDNLDTGNTNKADKDKSRLLARAKVKGVYTPAFINIMPWVEGIPFNATSDVAYAQRKGTPASIFFAVDNSGSMGWRDNDNKVKITSLETSMKDFMTTLTSLNNPTNRIFRTALYPYHSAMRTNHIVSPQWGPLTDNEVTRMYASGGTKSTPALTMAKNAFPSETATHKAANGFDEPLKFLVFMTDGENNATTEEVCTTTREDVWVAGESEYWWKRRNNGSIRKRYSRPRGRNAHTWTHSPSTPGYWDNQEVTECENVTAYHENDHSLAQCTAMKDAGVIIYSIAYDIGGNQSTKTRVENFMRDCSSGTDYFKTADDGDALEEAFTQIGASIVQEVIRVKR